jgi:hypothetical protein
MKKHLHKMHPMVGGTLNDLCKPSVKVQSLFSKFGRLFFQVEPALADCPSDDPLTVILRDIIPEEDNPVTPPKTDREVTPYLRVLKWDSRMASFREDRTKLALIKALKSTPKQSEADYAMYSKLKLVVLGYINHCIQVIELHPQSFTIRKLVLHGEHVPPSFAR